MGPDQAKSVDGHCDVSNITNDDSGNQYLHEGRRGWSRLCVRVQGRGKRALDTRLAGVDPNDVASNPSRECKFKLSRAANFAWLGCGLGRDPTVQARRRLAGVVAIIYVGGGTEDVDGPDNGSRDETRGR